MSFGEFFLTNPEGFGIAAGLAPYGPESVDIGLAGLSFRFIGLSGPQAEQLRQRYAAYLVGSMPHQTPIRTTLYRAQPRAFRTFDLRGWTYTLEMDYAAAKVRVAGLHLMIVIDCGSELAARLWIAPEPEANFTQAFENVFRLLTAYAALRQGGVLLHSAGISDGKRAWVGFGHSGAGKSTIARLALEAGQQVLSDDINVLRFGQDRWQAQRLPFAGELGPAQGDDLAHPLAGLLRLRKSAEHRLDPLTRAESLTALVASAPYVNRDPYRVQHLLTNLSALLRTVPCHSLSFRMDSDFWPLLHDEAQPSLATR